MTIEVLTGPAYEPVSRAEAKRWLRIENSVTDHDLVIDLLIQAMREDAENLTQRAFISRQLRLTLQTWPKVSASQVSWASGRTLYGLAIELPFPPLISVDAFRYVDTDGVLQTLAANQYVVHEWREPAWIVPEWDVTWPTIRAVPDALQIDFTAGYAPGSPSDEAANQEVMPAKLRLWMQAKAATLFEQREQIAFGAPARIPRDFCDALLDSLIVGTRLF